MVSKILSNKRGILTMLALIALFMAAPAMAQDNTVGGVADRISGQLDEFANLLTGAMFLVGIGLGAMAALKFKAHNEDPRSTKITTPIVLAVVSGLCFTVPPLAARGIGDWTPLGLIADPASWAAMARASFQARAVTTRLNNATTPRPSTGSHADKGGSTR